MRYLAASVAIGLWLTQSAAQAAAPTADNEAASIAHSERGRPTVRRGTQNPNASQFIQARAVRRAQQRHARLDYGRQTGLSPHRPTVSTNVYFDNLNAHPWSTWAGARGAPGAPRW